MAGDKLDGMIMKKTIEEMVNFEGEPEERTQLTEMLQAAFWYGQHVGAKRVCDKYRDLRKEQIIRAQNCRYHKMAKGILGETDLIYDGSYGEEEIGSWDFEVEND